MIEANETPEKDVLIMIPAYNEEKHLPQLLGAIKKQDHEILVIDDGSTDQTAALARENGVHVLSRGYNKGKGYSLKEGYQWAIDNGYKAVIMLDADGQHDPTRIPLFIEKFHNDHDKLIIGARDYSKMPFRRRIPNKIGKFLISAAFGQEIKDNQSGYRLLDSDVMQVMLQSTETGFHFEVEMIAVCIAKDWPIGWVTIPTIYDDEKSYQNPFDQIFGFPRVVIHARKAIQKARHIEKNTAN